MESVENHWKELYRSEATVINLITRQGPDYYTGNFAEKSRFTDLINPIHEEFLLTIKEK